MKQQQQQQQQQQQKRKKMKRQNQKHETMEQLELFGVDYVVDWIFDPVRDLEYYQLRRLRDDAILAAGGRNYIELEIEDRRIDAVWL